MATVHLLRRLITAVLLVALVAACQPERKSQRTLFEEAETAYRLGHYDLAIERYEAFIKAAPNHQLAPLAQQRILNIDRQLEDILRRKNGPRPIYLRPTLQSEGGLPMEPVESPGLRARPPAEDPP